MKILAVDSCTNVATGAVLNDGVLVAEFVLNNKITHSTKLLPQIEQMMEICELKFNDIDLFAVTIGPGSFTGERIGVATVKALAHGVNKPVIGVSALMSMAYNLPYTSFIVCPIMDARRNQVYTATYRWNGNQLETVKQDRAMSIEDLIKEFNEDVIFLGDGVPVYKDIILEKLKSKAHFAPDHLLHIRGGSVAMCAVEENNKGKSCTYSELKPSYLRLSQAEREYNDRIGK